MCFHVIELALALLVLLARLLEVGLGLLDQLEDLGQLHSVRGLVLPLDDSLQSLCDLGAHEISAGALGDGTAVSSRETSLCHHLLRHLWVPFELSEVLPLVWLVDLLDAGQEVVVEAEEHVLELLAAVDEVADVAVSFAAALFELLVVLEGADELLVDQSLLGLVLLVEGLLADFEGVLDLLGHVRTSFWERIDLFVQGAEEVVSKLHDLDEALLSFLVQ